MTEDVAEEEAGETVAEEDVVEESEETVSVDGA